MKLIMTISQIAQPHNANVFLINKHVNLIF